METQVTEATLAPLPVDPAKLPPGEYEGIWGGYVVKVQVGGTCYQLRTQEGIRTPRAECIVTVRNGTATVRVK